MIQTRKRPPRQRGEGLGGPKAKEAPAPTRRGPRWSQSEGGPRAHATGASMIQTRKRPPCQRGEGLGGPKAKEAPAPTRRGPRWFQSEGGPRAHVTLCYGNESPHRKRFGRRFCLMSQERSANSVFATSPHGGEKSIWLHYPCFLGVPVVGRNQPSKKWMGWKREKNGRKLVNLGENPNIPYPECERSIKIPVVKQQCPWGSRTARRPNSCTARALRLVHPPKGHRWGTGQKRFSARARHANAPPHTPSGAPILTRPSDRGDSGVAAEPGVLVSDGGLEPLYPLPTGRPYPQERSTPDRGDSGVSAAAWGRGGEALHSPA